MRTDIFLGYDKVCGSCCPRQGNLLDKLRRTTATRKSMDFRETLARELYERASYDRVWSLSRVGSLPSWAVVNEFWLWNGLTSFSGQVLKNTAHDCPHRLGLTCVS